MSRQTHLRSIEGARGLAALGVLTYHVGVVTEPHGWLYAWTSRLWLGVPLFFVLSGLLLYRPFAHATVQQTDWPSLRRFARARVLRIAPAYWLVLAVAMSRYALLRPAAIATCALFLFLHASVTRSRSIFLLALAVSAVAGVALAQAPDQVLWIAFTNDFLVYIPFGPSGVVGPAWTLCIEVSFYISLPLLALAAHRFARRGATPSARASRLAFALALAFPLGAVYLGLVAGGHAPVWLPAFIDEFAVGMLLAVALEVWPRVSARTSRLLLGGGAAFAAGANLVYRVGPDRPFGNGSGELFAPLMVVSFALVLASVLLRDERTVLGRVLCSRPLAAAGVVSYGLYLWHWPLIERLQDTTWWYGLNEAGALLAVLAGSAALATAMWFLVEKPSLAAKDRRRAEPLDASPPIPAPGHAPASA